MEILESGIGKLIQPFDLDEFLSRVKNLLAMHGQRAQLESARPRPASAPG